MMPESMICMGIPKPIWKTLVYNAPADMLPSPRVSARQPSTLYVQSAVGRPLTSLSIPSFPETKPNQTPTMRRSYSQLQF